jgi:hypothetical protein
MSNRWPAGIIRKTPVTPAGPFQNGAASGVWSLADAAYWTKQGLWPLAGNILAVEDVFSTWLYTGNGSTQTITNGIDLAGKGGMVWAKSRSASSSNSLYDTVRGAGSAGNARVILSNSSVGQQGPNFDYVSAFNSNGFSIAFDAGGGNINTNGTTYASWTFREAPNFFDVVTWTGDGANRTIAHNLGAAPGMMIVKRTDTASDWAVYHRGFPSPSTQYGILNNNLGTPTTATNVWNSTNPTASVFSVGTNAIVNASGGTYVAYLYAHDTSSTGLIQCGSFTTDGSANASVTLGWEPQWVMIKDLADSQYYAIYDNMRGLTSAVSGSRQLFASTPAAEGNNPVLAINATGFSINQYVSTSYVYMAIRRGPMRTPTLGTSVFAPLAVTPVTGTVRTTGFPVDLSIAKTRTLTYPSLVTDRLRGFVNNTSPNPPTLITTATDAETTATYSPASYAFGNTGYVDGPELNGGYPTAYWNFRRAPGFFDVVCWTNTGATQTINHNLGVVPELIITKRRPGADGWQTYSAATGASAYLVLNTTAAVVTGNTNRWNATAPTSTVFTTGSAFNTSEAYVAYLFASCPGVSKVGSYTGTGALQTVNCAFTTGARFVLIKRTDSTGDWFVWDSARGISSGNDPYLLLNTTAAEVTGTNYVDTDTTGFKVTAAAPAGINANGGSYIFLAIA